MTYRVLYSPSVRDNIRDHVRYLRDQAVSDEVIESWYNGVFETIDSLYEWPRRHPVDRAESRRQGFEVRKLVFHRKYVIRYRIDEAAHVVEVLSFVHGARRREL